MGMALAGQVPRGDDFAELLGRVDLTVPPQGSPDGRYHVFLVDSRTDTTVTVYGENGAGGTATCTGSPSVIPGCRPYGASAAPPRTSSRWR